MRNIFLFFIVIVSAGSCNRIETAETLSRKDVDRLHALKLLDTNERLFKFYSEFKNSVAGNFYTDKRLASYWLDERDTARNIVEFAFYNDIAEIDTVYYRGLTYCPYMLITKKDGHSFKVCVDGKRSEITDFFKDAVNNWKRHKQ
jgi:hypothetical protein